jgi:hypothetical protein
MPDISSIVERLKLKREIEIPILDTEEKIQVKYARAGSGALSVEGFDTIQKSIGKGEGMTIKDAAAALVAFQVEWDLTIGGQPVPPTAEGIAKVPMILVWIVINSVMSDFFQGVNEQVSSVSGSNKKRDGVRSRQKRNDASSPLK